MPPCPVPHSMRRGMAMRGSRGGRAVAAAAVVTMAPPRGTGETTPSGVGIVELE